MPQVATTWLGASLSGGRYQVTRKLGEGGMGTVYEATDRTLGINVVVKVPHLAVARDPEFVERFAREVRSLLRLSHPHIVKVLDAGTQDGLPFAVMQYLAGGSLADREGYRGSPAQVFPWLEDVCKALDFVHQQNYLHRDIKPGNILFDEHGNVYLSDFGIAKAVAEANARQKQNTLTGTGLVLGTPDYMAPELILGQPVDGRADQYALAVTVYELLSGRRPYEAPTPTAVMVMASSQPPNALKNHVPALPDGVCQVVHKAICKNPRDRYETCAAFSAALRSASQASTVPANAAQRLACPGCSRPLRVSTDLAGRSVTCPGCKKTLRVAADCSALRDGNSYSSSLAVVLPPASNPIKRTDVAVGGSTSKRDQSLNLTGSPERRQVTPIDTISNTRSTTPPPAAPDEQIVEIIPELYGRKFPIQGWWDCIVTNRRVILRQRYVPRGHLIGAGIVIAIGLLGQAGQLIHDGSLDLMTLFFGMPVIGLFGYGVGELFNRLKAWETRPSKANALKMITTGGDSLGTHLQFPLKNAAGIWYQDGFVGIRATIDTVEQILALETRKAVANRISHLIGSISNSEIPPKEQISRLIAQIRRRKWLLNGFCGLMLLLVPLLPAIQAAREASARNLRMSSVGNEIYHSKSGMFSLRYSSESWLPVANRENPESELELDHVTRDARAALISEELEVPILALKKLATANASKGFAGLKVAEDSTKTINGREIGCLVINGTLNKTPVTLYCHYFSGKQGSVQFFILTPQDRFEGLRAEFDKLINGLEFSPDKEPTATAPEKGAPDATPTDVASGTEQKSTPVEESSTYNGKRGAFSLRYPAARWKQVSPQDPIKTEFVLNRNDKAVFIFAISEPIETSIDALKAAAIENLAAKDAGFKVLKEGQKIVKEKEVGYLIMTATLEGIPLTYYGIYFSTSKGSVQFVMGTGSNLFNKTKPEFDRLLDGLEFPKVETKPWTGASVYPKPDAKVFLGKERVDLSFVDFPAPVDEEKADWLRIGRVRVKSADVQTVEDAFGYFSLQTLLKPAVAVNYRCRADLQAASDLWDEALKDYDQAIQLDPKDALAHLHRGETKLQKDDIDGAMSDFDEAIRLQPKLAAAYLARGAAWVAKEDLDRGVVDYSQVIRLAPRLSLGYVARGKILAAQGDEKAMQDFNQAIKVDPNDVEAYFWRGVIRRNKKQYDEAIKDFTDAIRLDAEDAAIFKARGLAWHAKGEEDKAIEDFGEAIRLSPKDPEYLVIRGMAWDKRDDKENALKDFDAAIQLDPKLAVAYYHRGDVREQMAQYEKAIDDYERAIAEDPSLTDAFRDLALLRASCPIDRYRDGDEAVKKATKACELTDWKSWQEVHVLAASHAEQGDFKEAVKWQEKTLELLTPDDPEVRKVLQDQLDELKRRKPK